MPRFLLFVLVVAITLSGCATLPAKVDNEIVPLGSRNPTWGGIRKSGVAEDVWFTPFFSDAGPKGKTNFFSKQSKQVTWWGVFQPAALGFARITVASFVARWYAPNGELYWEESFPGDVGAHFAKNTLPIAGTPAETFPGRWRVQIYYEGRHIDEKEFIINND